MRKHDDFFHKETQTMTRTQITLALTILSLAVVGASVFAQNDRAPRQDDQQSQMIDHGMMMGVRMGNSPEQWQQWAEQMRRMGMPAGMMMRCRLMNAAQIDAYDPVSVLTYQVGLDLSDEQIKKVQEIAAQARQQVKAVLNQDQIDKLQPMAHGPQNMAHVYQLMMQNPPQTSGNWMMMCPMMSPAAGTNAPQQGNMIYCPMRCW